jgi:hypothetical protein
MKLNLRWTMVLATLWATKGYSSEDPRIVNRSLNVKSVTQIAVSSGHVTTLLFPQAVGSIIGYGMTADPSAEEGWVQYAHPERTGLVTLRVIKPEMKVIYMTALVGERLYNFELDNAPESAALSVTLNPAETSSATQSLPVQPTSVTVPPVMPNGTNQVTKQEVMDHRVSYHPEKLNSLLQLAKEAPLMQKTSPELYQGYEEIKANNISDYGDVVVRVEEIHRFPSEDAVVLLGEIQNKGSHNETFDPVAMTIGVGERQYPAAFVDCVGKIEAGQTVKFGVIGQGDLDGDRAHLAVRNPFRLLLPVLHQEPSTTPVVKPPASPKTVKKHQTKHRHEANKKAVIPPPKPHWRWPWQKPTSKPTDNESNQ